MTELQELLIKTAFGSECVDKVNPNSDYCPYEVGKNYFVRTCTNYITGKLKQICGNELVFESASWVADTGRFMDAIKSGEYSEVEPYEDDVIVGRLSIIDATTVKSLPTSQK